MAKKFFKNIGEHIEDFLRGICGRITPDKRVIVILTMLVVFSGLSIYMTVSSIYNFGKDKGERMQIEALKLQLEQQRDSINQQNLYEYEPTE
ncbi:hypothetical protein M2459_002838 [Parabacteroides sp. PF5-5]|uniref:TraL conjugative transposon family protein n=1 Tax=unclassified Parabacteroides TaxID=2649774 RepID=UPI002473CBC9|nr:MULTISPECIES: TraL conjugative transposon family protein [unclassified Parabacteroides]MDH6306018.1 hypothetical protein [Parabacteroides sp. PH5-39]MDH6317084.1 hypothetical protein [Parabacteroides sp. PF5-13]MDH6320837.1 hypothetical protein [Parabacteroides sp. PH5-13]MDH6324461.1 hypothetical protein [Parabacteroides sp. PH5-8]MDH6328269.1 hypothetical protein [Parabacteroides sp. PH5-41]